MNYFVWYSNPSNVESYHERMIQKISIANELLKQPISDIMELPIPKLKKLLDWKVDFEEKKNEKLLKKMNIIPETKLQRK